MTTKKKTSKKVATAVIKKVSTPKKTPKVSKVTKKVAKKTTTVSKKTVKAKKIIKKTGKKIKIFNDDNLIHGIAPYVQKVRDKYMSLKQKEHFLKILMAWKNNLLDEVSKTIHLMQDENINQPDPNDRASQETDMSIELRNRDRERKLLKKIDSTVARVNNDDYGWCDRCGVEIGIRRLEARPTADLCVDCKTLNEIKEKQMI